MADNKDPGAAPALDTNIESGGFDEKRAHDAPVANEGAAAPPPKKAAEEEEEDADIDALIEDLESEDGHHHNEVEEEEEAGPSRGRVVPEELLQTDSRLGLTEAEVQNRRKKYGYNRMKEEKQNHILKFLGFFVGPIQFVMEVSFDSSFSWPFHFPPSLSSHSLPVTFPQTLRHCAMTREEPLNCPC